MRIRVLKTRILTPADRRTSVKFVAGAEVTTKREWGQVLVDAGEAKEIEPPKRPQAD